jgi:2-methylcitrate dehydratase PrpD
VVLEKDDRIEKNFPEEWPARVQVRLTSGKKFKNKIRFPKGDPGNPLTWEELSAKFQSLATRGLPKTRCEQIVKSIEGMNRSTVLREIWKLTAGENSLSRPAN